MTATPHRTRNFADTRYAVTILGWRLHCLTRMTQPVEEGLAKHVVVVARRAHDGIVGCVRHRKLTSRRRIFQRDQGGGLSRPSGRLRPWIIAATRFSR